MNTSKINTLTEQSFDHNKNSTVLYIENDYALDIFGINNENLDFIEELLPLKICLLYTSPSPRDKRQSRMPASA